MPVRPGQAQWTSPAGPGPEPEYPIIVNLEICLVVLLRLVVYLEILQYTKTLNLTESFLIMIIVNLNLNPSLSLTVGPSRSLRLSSIYEYDSDPLEERNLKL